MRNQMLLMAGATALLLSACAKNDEVAYAPPPPAPAGAVPGSVAADRDGDGIIDGYYTSDGVYHPNAVYAPPPPPPPTRVGEKG